MTNFDAKAWAQAQQPPTAAAASQPFDPAKWAALQPAPGDLSDEQLTSSLVDERNAPFDPKRRQMFPSLRVTDFKDGIPGWTTTQKSFKGSKVGELNFLRKKYGDDNVEPVLNEPRQIRDASGAHVPDPDYTPEIVNFRVRVAPDKVVLANPKGLDRSDFADMAAATVETVPAMAGSVAGAMIGGAAGSAGGPAGIAAGATKGSMLGNIAGGALGNIIRQGIGAGLDGAENLSWGDRALSFGGNIAANLIGEGAGRIGSKAIGAIINPTERIAARSAAREIIEPGVARETMDAAKSQAKPFSMVPDEPPPIPLQSQDIAQTTATNINKGIVRGREVASEARKLAEETGINFTPGQLTGGREQISFERMIAQLPGGKDIMAAGDIARANALSKYVDKVVTATAGERVGAEEAGRAIGQAFDKHMTGLAEKRAAAATKGFGEAYAAAPGRVVPVPNAIGEIDAMIDSYRGAFTSNSAQKIIDGLNAFKEKLMSRASKVVDGKTVPGTADDVRVTVQELQNDLREIGKNAAGAGKWIDTGDRAVDKQVAARFFGGLQRDLSAAAESSDPALARAASGLKAARDGYREMSKVMEAEKDRVLTNALELDAKGTPEAIVTKIATGRNFTDQQVQRTMAKLNAIDPVAARQLRGEALGELLIKAEPADSSMLARSDVPLSPRKFASMAQKNSRRIKALFEGDPDGWVAWQKAMQSARMLGDDAGISGSQTAPFQMFAGLWQAMTTIGPRAVTSPIATAREVGSAVAGSMRAKQFAEVFNNPQARDVYLGLASQKRSLTREQIVGGVGRIKAILERDRQLFSAPPQTEDTQAPEQPQQPATPRNIATIGAAE